MSSPSNESREVQEEHAEAMADCSTGTEKKRTASQVLIGEQKKSRPPTASYRRPPPGRSEQQEKRFLQHVSRLMEERSRKVKRKKESDGDVEDKTPHV